MGEVLIVSTGTANIASVRAAFGRLGAEPKLATSAEQIRAASHVVLPGVGTFGAALQELRRHAYDAVLHERITDRRPTLCVCVGLQVLAATSEESPGEAGLAVLDTAVTAFSETVRVPQFGWNKVSAGESCNLLDDGYAYFANSFRMTTLPAGWSTAKAEHGGAYIAAIESGGVLGCQFHPELSGAWGQALLERWLAQEDSEC